MRRKEAGAGQERAGGGADGGVVTKIVMSKLLCIMIQEINSGLERRLSDEQHLLNLQRTQVQFPAQYC